MWRGDDARRISETFLQLSLSAVARSARADAYRVRACSIDIVAEVRSTPQLSFRSPTEKPRRVH